jgi:hypothetical protein
MILNIDFHPPRLLTLLFLGSLHLAASAAPVLPSQLSTTHKTTSPVGLSYFVFFDGPGLAPGNHDLSPNVLGLPEDDGLRLTNYLSAKYRLNETWAVDFQARFQWIVNNARGAEDFEPVRWQSPRIGISGKILSGENWSVTGAINTDFPYFFPEPLGGGYVAEKRTTVFNPGLFAKFLYRKSDSPWSFSSLLMPRLFFYQDRNAAEAQLQRAGYSPGLKPELALSISPSLNYGITRTVGLRLGSELTYRKLVLSGWNPFQGSLNGSDTSSKAWRLAPVPLQLGVTYEPEPELNLSVFVQGFPIGAQRVRKNGEQAAFTETLSVGMWISGTLL